MKARTIQAWVLFSALTAVPAAAQDPAAAEVLNRYRALRPTGDDLAMYRLDWAASVDEAKERAAREDRPVLVLAIHARYGDFYTGHC